MKCKTNETVFSIKSCRNTSCSTSVIRIAKTHSWVLVTRVSLATQLLDSHCTQIFADNSGLVFPSFRSPVHLSPGTLKSPLCLHMPQHFNFNTQLCNPKQTRRLKSNGLQITTITIFNTLARNSTTLWFVSYPTTQLTMSLFKLSVNMHRIPRFLGKTKFLV